jgi:hypothetical protein
VNLCKWIWLTIPLLALSFSLRIAAQKFQEPTKEELQMTSDPKAPDAPAVFLDREETTNNQNHYTSAYAHQGAYRKGQGVGDGKGPL